MKNTLLTLLALFVITESIAQNCAASISYQTYNCPDFAFDPLITIDSTDQISTYTWDFGDGNMSNSYTGYNTYTSDGSYLVCFSFTTVNGCSYTECDTVEVACSQSGATCESYFTVADSACPNVIFYGWTEFTGNISSFYFDFGDGANLTNTWGNVAVHNYVNNGSYLACLTVTTIDNCISTYCDTITINCILGLKEGEPTKRELVKVVDLMGRQTKDQSNTPLIYIYSDGTMEKVFKVE